MSAVVIDFQGFQLAPHSFVVKEFAFYDVQYDFHGRWSFQPPHSWEKLSSRKQKTYEWVIRNVHGMSWESGDLPYGLFRRIMMFLFASYHTIYVKGLEKVKFLQKFSQSNIIDLNDMKCPKIQNLRIPAVKCPFHNPQSHYCALNKAAAFSSFISNHRNQPNSTQIVSTINRPVT